MKIVLNKNNGGMICHVQVKDFLRLARIRGDKKFAQYYVHFINSRIECLIFYIGIILVIVVLKKKG